MVVVSQLLC